MAENQLTKIQEFQNELNREYSQTMEELENGIEHRITEKHIRNRVELKTDHPEDVRTLKLPGKQREINRSIHYSLKNNYVMK